jgi:hypothetical protein
MIAAFFKVSLKDSTMSRNVFNYTKEVLIKVSFDSKLFSKELDKALKVLLPFEIEELIKWLIQLPKKNLNYIPV